MLRRTLGALVASLVISTGLVVGTAATASASSEEYDFLAKTNSARQSHGLRALTMSSDLVSIARNWSAHMASGGCAGSASICHNPSLSSQASNWQKIGENVGVGGDVASIQNAFMNSPSHRANILDPAYTQVGIGTVRGKDGRIYVTVDFRQPMNSGSTSSGTTQKKPSGSGGSSSGSSSPAPSTSAPSSGSTYSPSTPTYTAPAPKPTLEAKIAVARAKAAKGGDPVQRAMSWVETMERIAR